MSEEKQEEIPEVKVKEDDSYDPNLVKDFMESDEFLGFFPDQVITFRLFEFPKITIQTIFKTDEKKYLQNPMDSNIQIIEYYVNLNYIPDPEHIGPKEEAQHIKIMDTKNPFILSITSEKDLDKELEDKYLNNFKTIFIKLLELVLVNLNEKDIEKINKEE